MAVSQTLTGSYRHDGFFARVTSCPPCPSAVEVTGGTSYQDMGELVRDTSLVLRDGSVLPAADLILWPIPEAAAVTQTTPSSISASFTSQFQELLDVSQVTAVRVGDVTIPLT